MPPPPDSPHADLAPRKRRRKRDDPQSYFTNSEEYESDEGSPVSCSDVESFQGKIVYNPDGSAYIIDSENESLSNISETGLTAGLPTANNPKIHSFRVVNARDATINKISEPNKIQKPILMCFICKLSFGNTKSFGLHANSEHTLNLHESEKLLLNREYSSAIIQRNVDEKPQISFLEPLDVHKQLFQQQFQNSSNISSVLSSTTGDCTVSTNTPSNTSSSSSCTPTLSAANNSLSSTPLQLSSNLNSQMLDSTTATTTSSSSSTPSSSSSSSSLSSQTSTTSPTSTSTSTSSTIINNSNKLNSDISNSATLIKSNAGYSGSSNVAGQNLSDFVQQQFKQQQQRSSTPSASQASSLGLTNSSPINIGLSNNNNSSSNNNNSSNSLQSSPIPTTAPVSSYSSSAITTTTVSTTTHGSDGGNSSNNCGSNASDLSTSNSSSNNNNSTKLLNEFLQQQQQQILQQQQQQHTTLLACPEHQGFNKIAGLVDCKSCELININNLAKSSPMTPTKSPNSINLTTPPSSASLTSISPTTPAPSFTIGACPDHINGRPIGVDCGRCEMILSSARLNSGSQISTRNSCKTLKCPQCNWHYKYQETLEIHMREKHPDGESACGYCLAGQQHPRLARGESYTCGYKPYRCEICNYSTTTKGNLSIHMQSDKHLNNMQELNNSQNLSSTNDIRENPKIVMPNMPQQTSKPKPSFRCDVCSYETSVARNLRIHMTSEKHTHNMAVLQNNMKHFQALSFLQSQNLGAAAAANIPNLSQMPSLQQNMPNLQNFLPEAALADLAYNQALMIQLLHQNSAAGALGAAAAAAAAAVSIPQQQQQQQQQSQSIGQQLSSTSGCGSTSGQLNVPTTGASSSAAASSNAAAVAAAALLGSSLEPDQGLNLETLEPPIEPDQRPTTVYSCLICSAYNTNSIDELNNHLMVDRSRNSSSAANNCNSDIMLIINNNYICRLCNYKTNLKANFQLHSKTDKHIQKLNYINHIKEGGAKNEYKLKYNNTNTVQLKCNCCDFYTNSIQKLNLHTQHMRHDTMKMIFNHLVYIDQLHSIQQQRRQSTSTPTSTATSQSIADNQRMLNAISSGGNNSDIDQQQSSGAGHLANIEGGNTSASGSASGSGGASVQPTHTIICELCNYKSATVLQMIQHVKSIRHVQVEQFICLQRRSENLEPLELSDVFKIVESGVIKSEKCSPVNSPVDPNLGSTPNPQPSTPHSRHSDGGRSSVGLLQSPSSLPNISTATTIFKCNNCDFFAETKQDMEMHIDNVHPNCLDSDYMTIPTNSTALHAFQAAMAAAAAAAAANKPSCSPQTSGNTTLLPAVTPNSLDEIKSERMDADTDSVGDGTEPDQQDLEGMDGADAGSNATVPGILCPLCQDSFNDRKSLESHVMGVHSVNSDGLTRLLQLVDTSHWLNSTSHTKKDTDESGAGEKNHASNNFCMQQMRGDELECNQCELAVKTHQELLMHAQETQHYPSVGDQYQCLLKQCPQNFSSLPTMIAHFKDTHMNIVISERHVYKYRCKQCSLAFKTQEKLNTHSLYHTMRDATKCMICNRSFRSTQSLQKHMEQAHNQQQSNSPSPPPSDQDHGKQISGAGMEDFITSPASSVKQDDESAQVQDLMLRDDQLMLQHSSLLDCTTPTTEMDEYLNTSQMAEDNYNDPGRKHKCHKCKMAFTHQNFLAIHYKSNQHRRNEKLNNYPMEKYLDPNRPFKCEICLESFTQKNILLVHYNSVSHLHKLKKQSENNNTPSSSPSNNPSPMDYDRKSVDSDRRSVERDRKSIDLDLEIMNEQQKRKLSPENDYDSPKKRFKCDICKVAYAQGSTLDIHMRSVLHQTRACRLQEQQQMQLQHSAQFNPSLTTSLARIVEQHQQQQQQQQSVSPAPSNLSGIQDDPNMPKFNNQIYKTLLENFGFDIVKQFNELKHTGGEINREINEEKYFCRHCKKTFSSIFVLKSHCEEIHNDKIPLDVLEKFAEKFKNYYLETSDTDNEILDFSAKKLSPETSDSPNSSFNGSGNTTALTVSTKEPQPEKNQRPSTPVSTSGLSPASSPSSQQQQQALLKSQQTASQVQQQLHTALSQSQSQQSPQMLPTDLAQKFNIDPTILAQKIMEQNLANVPPNFANLPQNLQSLQNLQNLQNLQSLQNLPNMPNLPLNTLDMLSLMQFHHLMSLNFMNLAPPLIFGATGAAAAAAAIAGGNVPPVTPEIPVNPGQQVQLLQQQAAAAAQQATNNQKRARTRITDEQLKILRAHFDINNSPSEESIMEMSKKANLPMKVVKHWFRNTLFKERQRNKDSPYNFNNPPSTTLNLEEYERTGQAKVTSLVDQSGNSNDTSQSQQQQQQSQLLQSQSQQRQQQDQQQQQQHHQFHQQHSQQSSDNRPLSQPSSTASDRGADIQIKTEPNDDLGSMDPDQQSLHQHSHQLQHSHHHLLKHDQQHEHDPSSSGGGSYQHSQHQQQMFYNNFETKSESGSSEILSRPQTPTNSSYNNLGEMTNTQIDTMSLGSLGSGGGVGSSAGASGMAGVVGNLNNMGPPKKFQMNKIFDKNNFETNSNSSNSSSSSGKRANRTRFTDYQIKVLQEFFENNSYPKDSDLEYLSKLLLLSPRVIVVWFQNARQKQRKIYENQPNNSFYESEEKKPNINYTCKKCNLVFQRYYELIRHQKNHCFKEENNKKSAKAQIAAAQIAQSLSSEDSNSSIDINSANLLTSNLAAQQAAAAAAAAAAIGGPVPSIGLPQSPSGSAGSGSITSIPGLSTSPGLGLLASPHGIFGKHAATVPASQNVGGSSTKDGQSPQKFECDKCNLSFPRFELFKEHQLIHIMNPNLFLNQNYAENTPFGILQNMQNNLMNAGSVSGSNNSGSSSASLLMAGVGGQDTSMDLSQANNKKKRKYSETQSSGAGEDIQSIMAMQSSDYDLAKKFRSEQYDFLYQYFLQNEPNDELKKQYQQQQHQQSIDIEYLAHFYQMSELKKKGNYDFFYQYYLQNESKQQSDGASSMLENLSKPNMEFLLQYYQLNECKKFFQLGASPQRIHDFPLLNLTTMPSASDTNSTMNSITQQSGLTSTNIAETSAIQQSQMSGNGNSTTREICAATGRGTATPTTPKSTTPTGAQAMQAETTTTPSSMASMISSPTHAAAVVAATILAAGGSGVVNQKIRQDQHQQQLSIISTTTIGGNALNADSSPQHQQSSLSNLNTGLPISSQLATSLQKSACSPPIATSTTSTATAASLNDFPGNPSASSFLGGNSTTPTPTGGGVVSGVEHVTTMEKQTNKRLRTTILPEQLNFLYECYQNESNPSRKMLEEISKKVNLKKRVVQ
ncbi:zinc finger protein 2 isoform X4 [Hermetia illucens]|nr:zinc finger protein 2 isoform X3 [Hermetia illucens]XP_037926033.1 zinc finger protein 2 isoform X4 [Hermetia illucens]